MAAHGTITRYRDGCRCDDCKASHAASERGRLRSVDTQQEGTQGRIHRAAAQFVDLPPPGTVRAGPNEVAVAEEAKGLSGSAERPAMVTAALALARVLDDPLKWHKHDTVARQLHIIMNDLRASSWRKSKGRIAAVRQLNSQAVGE